VTFSIVARCAASGQYGVAISSSSPAVAARCAHARAGVGAAATQNVTNPALGPLMLGHLAAGGDATGAVAAAVAADGHGEHRQLLAVDRHGGTAVHSGSRTLGAWGAARGRDCAAGGNLLADAAIPAAMVAAFEASSGPLGNRLLAAMHAALALGGEEGPLRSAGMLVVHQQSWPYVDLRADWDDGARPIEAIARAWEIYAPQADQYITRALRPCDAPPFGVPGDEGRSGPREAE
jgi:uncharacterized Ntn-hydrolase superfamily protein